MKKLWVRLSALVAVLILAQACSGNGGKKGTSAAFDAPVVPEGKVACLQKYVSVSPLPEGGVFTRSLPADVVTLNPVVANDTLSYLAFKWVFDPLIDMDSQMHPVGVLAESWEMKDKGLETIFHLRKKVKWHDGAPFTADDVVFTYNAAMDPKVDAVNKRPAFAEVAGVEKVDRFTVRVRWKEPFAPGLSAWVFYIIPKHVYGYPKGRGDLFNHNPANRKPVGTGPFVFDEWKRGQRLVLKANADYFAGRPHIDKLVFKVIPKSQMQMAAFKTGQLDLVSLSTEQWKNLAHDRDFSSKAWLFSYLTHQFYFIAWNEDGSNPFFRDVRVRRAMTLSLNRKGVVGRLLGGHGVIGSGPFFPRGWAASPDVRPLPFDPNQAAALLDEAGWKDSDGDGVRDRDNKPFAFDCMVPAEAPQFTRFLEIFQQNLKRLGVKMSIRKVEWSVFLDRTHRHNFQAYLSGWSLGDDPDPFQLLHSSQAKLLPSGMGIGQNDFSYSNPEVDRLIEEEERTVDQAKRAEIFHRMGKLVADDQPVTVLFWGENLVALRKNFQGVRASPVGYGLFGWYPSMLDWWVPKELQRKRQGE